MEHLTPRSGYQLPPDDIVKLVDVPAAPAVSLSYNSRFLLLFGRPNMPTLAEVAQPELRLAGLRINTATHSVSAAAFYNSITVKYIADQREVPIQNLPAQPKIEYVALSPDCRYLAFSHTTPQGLELWIADLERATAERYTDAIISAVIGSPFTWFSDSRQVLIKTILPQQGLPPQAPLLPNSPIIQENKGGTAPLRTYQDLLKNELDEALFAYYTTTQLALLTLATREQTPFGEMGMISGYSPSPDGQYVMVFSLKKPFSYLTQYDRFPFEVVAYTRAGERIKTLFDIPLSENIPKGFNAVRTGARAIQWRSDRPHTLVYVEAQDEGDPAREAAIRDRLFSWDAPFDTSPAAAIDFQLRYAGVTWGSGSLAICSESWWQTREVKVSTWQPDTPATGTHLLFAFSAEDSYNHPGNFELQINEYGKYVLLTTDAQQSLYLFGQGASPQGNYPFIDKLHLPTQTKTRLWQCQAPHYEYPVELIDVTSGWILTRQESKESPPNYLLRNMFTEEEKAITQFPNPYTSIVGVYKELVRYQRADGVELTGTLYLPKGYDAATHGRLPVLMWAYPREFKSAQAAGQVTDSPHEFIRFSWASPIFWITQGYAVFDDFSVPIVGEGKTEPNETFIQQMQAAATAAVDVLVARGIADPARIAVGGHSYGAFMTANLLAHTQLFAAGIARSGAFNRTLTPFGFQAEERTLWEAIDTYMKMSPFLYVHQIKAPLLLIHGEADDNSGTFPLQSERFFAALKGHGATTRLVVLPHERHAYRAIESIMHVLWEQHQWLETHVKQAPLADSTTQP